VTSSRTIQNVIVTGCGVKSAASCTGVRAMLRR
jgi:hypothetical protein